jgi:hypothetical protein
MPTKTLDEIVAEIPPEEVAPVENILQNMSANMLNHTAHEANNILEDSIMAYEEHPQNITEATLPANTDEIDVTTIPERFHQRINLLYNYLYQNNSLVGNTIPTREGVPIDIDAAKVLRYAPE